MSKTVKIKNPGKKDGYYKEEDLLTLTEYKDISISLDEVIDFWEMQVDNRFSSYSQAYCLTKLIDAMARKIKDKHCE